MSQPLHPPPPRPSARTPSSSSTDSSSPALPSQAKNNLFVGRERELKELQEAWATAGSGRGQVRLLVGEPGIGKTRLTEEFATLIRQHESLILWGRCWEGDGAPAFWPWRQLVRTLIQQCAPHLLTTELGTGATVIAQVVPELHERLPHLPSAPADESEHARFRFFDSFTLWLKRVSSRQPLLLILDDLHWADTSSLLLLQFLARELHDARLLVLGTFRDTDVTSGHPLSEVLGALSRESQRIELHGLAVPEIAQLVEERGLEPTETLISTLHQGTDGNPFFLSEALHLLARDGSSSLMPFPISQGVRDTLHRRLARLSQNCRQLLAEAAVIGCEFGLDLLSQIRHAQPVRERTDLLALLQEALTARWVSEVPNNANSYRFVHALVRETLYEDLTLPERSQLHRHVGEAIEHLYSGYLRPYFAELAHHFFKAATAGQREKAIQYALQAGERADALFAYEEAAILYERVVQILPLQSETEGQRCDVLLALGSAQAKAGEIKKARATFLQAAAIARKLHSQADPQHAATSLARAAVGLMLRSDAITRFDQGLVDLLEEALHVLPNEDTKLRARVCGTLAVVLYFSPASDRRAALSQQAVEIARRLGDTATLAFSLYAKHFATWGPDNLDDRMATARELIQVAEKSGGKELAIGGHFWRLLNLLESGDADGFDHEFHLYLESAGEYRHPAYRWRATVLRTMRALFEGRFEEGEQLAQEGFTLGQQAQSSNAFLIFAVQIFGLRKEQGRLHELEDALKGFVERYPGIPAFRSGLAFLYTELGRAEEARIEFEQLAATQFTVLPRDGNWLNSMDELARVCVFLGDTQRAEQLYDMLQPYAARNVVFGFADGCNGSVACYLGILATVLARWSDAEQHFQAALTMNERFHARPFVAHTQHEYARMLLARSAPGDHEHARQLLAQALSTAQELGMTRLEEKVKNQKAKGKRQKYEETGDWRPKTSISSPSSLKPQASSLKKSDPELRTPNFPQPQSSVLSPQSFPPPTPNLFHQEGDYWNVTYDGLSSYLRDTKGLHHLACLLREPGREFHVLDLLTMTNWVPPESSNTGVESALPLTIHSAQPAYPDRHARLAYRQRLRELREDLTEAEHLHDLGRGEKARIEIEFITNELATMYGVHQSPRHRDEEIEKARKTITNRIRTALNKVKSAHPTLWRHLHVSLHTGAFCSYTPEKPTTWQV